MGFHILRPARVSLLPGAEAHEPAPAATAATPALPARKLRLVIAFSDIADSSLYASCVIVSSMMRTAINRLAGLGLRALFRADAQDHVDQADVEPRVIVKLQQLQPVVG